MKIVALSLLALSLGSCSSTTSNPPASNSEFVADSANFAKFTTWAQDGAPRVGPDPTVLLGNDSTVGGPHGCCDTNVTRTTYMNSANPQRDASHQFPTGTIFLKTSSMGGQVQMITAMAKRGGSYNPSGHGWEWFMLSPNGQIMTRGDTLMGGMCQGCHSAAGPDKDFIFTR